mmetsp:Transcript_35613/g.87106  ORF Transcript_35613/g.87106 Transcript_35613/m.87106 type:complete len:81 (-) Transcript_35613:593-835(-)
MRPLLREYEPRPRGDLGDRGEYDARLPISARVRLRRRRASTHTTTINSAATHNSSRMIAAADATIGRNSTLLIKSVGSSG